jgi:hypothetical protein
MPYAAPHLSPHLIARSLDELRTWRLPEEGDLVGAHRGALKAMTATEALAGLELPLDLQAPRPRDTREAAEWDMVANLLAQAEGTLRGAAHRLRIAHLCRTFPGHASQLERLRRRAADKLGSLRARVDFVCQGAGSVPVAIQPVDSPRSPLLQ